jgi:TPR repeat protein
MDSPSNPVIAAAVALAQHGDTDEALVHIDWPARRGVPEAMVAQGYLLALRNQPGDRAAAVALFRQAVNLGEPAGHFGLTIAFVCGYGVKADALGAYIHLLAAGRTDAYTIALGRWLRAQLTDLEAEAAIEMAKVIGPKVH